MNRIPVILLGALLGLLTFAGVCVAGKAGNAYLTIRQRGTESTTPAVQVGDILDVEAYVEGRGEPITQVTLFLSFDDTYLELIPFRMQGEEIIPFQQGEWLAGQLWQNNTLGDVIGDSDANPMARFQLYYSELIPINIATGDQRIAVGSGVVARFRLQVKRKPPNGATGVVVHGTSPIGSPTGFFVRGDAGTDYSFKRIENLQLTVRGLDLAVQLPDLYLLPGQVDRSLDLDDYIDDPVNPDSTLTWLSSPPVPDSIQVAVDSLSHVVTVDPRLSETESFIGVARVAFTATTRFDEDATDTIRVIVDTSPAFDIPAMRAAQETPQDEEDPTLVTVTFPEDGRDESLVLIASDPDPGAEVRFASIDTLVDIFPDIGENNRVTFTAKRNYFGEEVLHFAATDQFGLADTVRVRVVVTSVNDPPEFIKDFPVVRIGSEGKAVLTMADFVVDADDPLEDLEFLFTDSDSISFGLSPDNARMTVTALVLAGADTAEVTKKIVVTDPPGDLARQSITIQLLPPGDLQPPEVLAAFLKVNVRAGGGPTTVNLDSLVNDPDTPKSGLQWTHDPVTLVRVDQAALRNRELAISAAPDSVGIRQFVLTVSDPTGLFDTLPVRVYSASPVTGEPVSGGLPPIVLEAGGEASLDLDDYAFDADTESEQVSWTASGQKAVGVEIGADPPHTMTLQVPAAAGEVSEDIVLTASDPEGHSASDTISVQVLNPGAVLLDLSVLQAGRTVVVSRPDTLDLDPLLLVGDRENVVWTAQAGDSDLLFSQVTSDGDLLLVGLREGVTPVTITVTDPNSGKSDAGDLEVTVLPQGGAALQVEDIGPLTLTVGRDTTIDLKPLVVVGDVANLVWTAGENPNVTVAIDSLEQLATLTPAAGFVGEAGDILFQVEDPEKGEAATSLASPVKVVLDPTLDPKALLQILVVINPVLKNFLDVFVVSRQDLTSAPFLFLKAEGGGAPETRSISLKPVNEEEVPDVWVGDLVLSDQIAGEVELTATGITQAARIALTDTLTLQVGQVGAQKPLALSGREVTVTLPPGAVDAASAVALIPERRADPGARAKPAADAAGLKPASTVYRVYAPSAEIRQPGEIRFEPAVASGLPAQTGVYRWDGATQRWQFVGCRRDGGGVAGALPAFGRYGLFVDDIPPSPGGLEALPDGASLAVSVEEAGSGVDPKSIALSLDGAPVIAAYRPEEGRVVWTPEGGIGSGLRTLRLALADLAGNRAVWERRVDLAGLVKLPVQHMLHQNFPNPFNPSTTIRFEVPEETEVRLTIYNTLGQEVRRLLEGRMPAGRHAVSWDARDAAGRPVAAGAYIYRMDASGVLLVRKMLLLK